MTTLSKNESPDSLFGDFMYFTFQSVNVSRSLGPLTLEKPWFQMIRGLTEFEPVPVPVMAEKALEAGLDQPVVT